MKKYNHGLWHYNHGWKYELNWFTRLQILLVIWNHLLSYIVFATSLLLGSYKTMVFRHITFTIKILNIHNIWMPWMPWMPRKNVIMSWMAWAWKYRMPWKRVITCNYIINKITTSATTTTAAAATTTTMTTAKGNSNRASEQHSEPFGHRRCAKPYNYKVGFVMNFTIGIQLCGLEAANSGKHMGLGQATCETIWLRTSTSVHELF